MQGFLTKPFSEKQLFQIISKTLDLKTVTTVEKNQEDYISSIKKLANNDPVFMKDMLLLFITSTQETLEKIDRAISESDWPNVSELAHKIAPQCKQTGDKELYNGIKELEKLAGNQPVNEKIITELFIKIRKKITEINQTFEAFLNNHK
jgi:HPt (histidine-containing phosphotransfer) domain-containing protein